ncbi:MULTISPECIES: hypothetical protein [unclassified Bradyrhizobium]|uniref:hypothetical protein n=1 Tax=unclassified Bradyrhizobium TaxID=2631580 RepID=UPI00244C21F4|nr:MULTISPECIES: hypothetical protein [unclassified Bradyrhizobium]MDH2341271.1 hypothetical protein [Bradyrhizobium sp. SSUT77]MDH2351853.1 hypothetical protein [Bradyrhizobium sp. SSUT112]
MPIFRYFVFVGGALLALLFAVNFVLPASPVTQAVATASNEQPLIRIRSDRHLPERVVLDTSQPTIAAPAVKIAAVAAPKPPVEGMSPALAEMSAKARVRETFAQFTPAGKADTAVARKTEAKPQAQAQLPQAPVQPKRKVARAHPAPQQGRPMMVMAQQPHFGFFNSTW